MFVSAPVARAITVPLKNEFLLRQRCFIRGAWTEAADGRTIPVRNPASGATIGTVPRMGTGEARRAVEAAAAALPAWRGRTAMERAAILRRWFELIIANQEDLATLMTAEQGKPMAESRGEIASAAGHVEWFAEEGKRVYGDTIPHHQADKRILVLKEPVGVVAAITPWTFPAAMITRKAGPALAAGCTVVLKPASATPFSALALAELGEQAGLPAGAFNVITGDSDAIGTELTTNPLVRKLSFTGSPQVGKQLMAQCASTVKKVSLELGGTAPFIVFDDADLDAAVLGVLHARYRNSGQACVCTNRVLVQDGVYDLFARKLSAAVAELKVGDGLRAETQQGPLIDEGAVRRVEEHIADAVARGATVATGGGRHALGGTFFQPTVITNVTPAMKVSREGTFGPLAPLHRFKTEDEALQLANGTGFGLASCFYTRDLARSWRVSERLEYGMVGLNTGLVPAEVAPFGGSKESGAGREGPTVGIEEYLEVKYVCIGGIT
jgi:succinate-semialdehyde dehydrogenase / glutarate-semialdehyde dehydrogenase